MDLTVGQLILLPVDYDNYRPANIVPCQGNVYLIVELPYLFQYLGSKFGGDGYETFGVPDIPPVKPLNGPALNWYICIDGISGGLDAVQYLGEISPLCVAPSGNSQLEQWTVPCDGAVLQVNDHKALAHLLGTQFGGDGVTTFKLPTIAPLQLANHLSLPYYLSTGGIFPSSTCDAVTPGYSSEQSVDAFLGSISMFPYLPEFVDRLCGYALCKGQLIDFAGSDQWENLFSILGTRYGGDGKKTFGLPNLPSGPGGFTYAMVTSGIYPLANLG